jgi:hypothetical protein
MIAARTGELELLLVVPDSRKADLTERQFSRKQGNQAILIHKTKVTGRNVSGTDELFEVVVDALTGKPLIVRKLQPDPWFGWRAGEQEAGPNAKPDWVIDPSGLLWTVLGDSAGGQGWLNKVEEEATSEMTGSAVVQSSDGHFRVLMGNGDFSLVRISGDDRLFKPNEVLRKALLKT